VETDEQWTGLVRAIGSPAWATDLSLSNAPGRRSRHDEIDGHLAGWCAERSGDQIVECLWAADVPVAKVMQPHEQATLPPLQHRGFFEQVDHPVTGTARHSTLPMRFSRGPDRLHRRPAPLLGEHTEAVLGALGVSDTELAQLEADGVIGHAPAGR
jgi:crotonobetainyl-CoA:carnitine CoA-transferase CaiB-like acyl-CoA transferase